MEQPRGRSRVSDRDATLESFGIPGGPAAQPGTFTFTLDVDGRKLTKTMTVELDPRYDIAASDVVMQRTTGLELRELTSRVNAIVGSTTDLLRQLTALRTQLGGDDTSRVAATRPAGVAAPRATPQTMAAIDSAIRDLTHFRDSTLVRPEPQMGYRQYPRLLEEVSNVDGMVWRGISAPTAGEKLRLTELKQETDQAQARLDALVTTRIARVNELLGGTPHVIPPTKKTTFVP